MSITNNLGLTLGQMGLNFQIIGLVVLSGKFLAIGTKTCVLVRPRTIR